MPMNEERIKELVHVILSYPTITLADAQSVAQNLGATAEELQEAWTRIQNNPDLSHRIEQAAHDTPPLSVPDTNTSSLKKTIKKMEIMYGGGFVLVISLLLLLIFKDTIIPHSANQPQETIIAQKKDTTPHLIPQVYANQSEVNAEEVFSYKGSDITLHYTGQPVAEIFGFFPYWMLPAADKINLDGITAISLFGLTSDANGNIITVHDGKPEPGWQMWNSKELETFITRAKSKDIKLYITIKNFNKSEIERLVSSEDAQKQFISNAVQLVESKNLDGVNIDFEYLTTPEPHIRFGFTKFIANLQAELKRKNSNYALTVDTFIKSGAEKDFFDINLLQEYVDSFVIMGYDFSTPGGNPGPVAPLEGTISLLGYMQSYLERVPPEKLILAVPYYGYDWPTTQPASAEKEKGKIVSYAEVMNEYPEQNILWNEVAQTPYLNYKDTTTGQDRIIHFENVRSLAIKYDFIRKKNLKGVGIWALGYDGNNQELHQLLLDKFTN